MDGKDMITIERWELEDIIDTFRMLTQTFPKIKERDSCLDRQIMKSYARLVFLYNGVKFDYHNFCEYYMGKKDIPKLKKEETKWQNKNTCNGRKEPLSEVQEV